MNIDFPKYLLANSFDLIMFYSTFGLSQKLTKGQGFIKNPKNLPARRK